MHVAKTNINQNGGGESGTVGWGKGKGEVLHCSGDYEGGGGSFMNVEW